MSKNKYEKPDNAHIPKLGSPENVREMARLEGEAINEVTMMENLLTQDDGTYLVMLKDHVLTWYTDVQLEVQNIEDEVENGDE
jgi:hypothetical protein